jgi:hypothetical protein
MRDDQEAVSLALLDAIRIPADSPAGTHVLQLRFSGRERFLGPYPDAQAAMVAAERVEELLGAAADACDLRAIALMAPM